jgi:hypothetical protein
MFQYIPCGHCEECRNTSRQSWSFRLQAELEYRAKLGWKCGFITLTYDPQFLPMMPDDIFEDDAHEDMPCFDRVQVRDYILAVRKWLHRHYGTKSLVYMVCSEYGKRGRPHYHMVVSWEQTKCLDKSDLGNRPVLDAQQMHKVLRCLWKYGYVFPQYWTGGFDGHYFHKPFEVVNVVSFAAKYASKYCCKDINFSNALNHHNLIPEEAMTEDLEIALKNSKPFHLQSRSLGWSLVANMSDSEKLHLLEVGYNFFGTEVFENIPLYIRNKLYFDPAYVVDSDGKRLVRREATSFFLDNFDKIYDLKVEYYAQLLDRMSQSDFFEARRIDSEKAQYFANSVRERREQMNLDAVTLAQNFVSWFAVWPMSAYDVDPKLQWMSRYTDYWFYADEYGELKHDEGLPVGNLFDFVNSKTPLKSREFLQQNDEFWHFIFDTLKFTNGWMLYDADVADVADYHRKYLDSHYDGIYQTVERPLSA